jgi:hypothetical protein
VLTVLGLSGLLALAACGGGNGAPNNPYNPTPGTPPLQLAPPALTAYSGVPVTLTITSGVSPFTAFTNNAAALPVTQNVAGNTIVLLPNKVAADTVVTLTVKDSASQTTTAAVTVKASPLFNSFTFTPSGKDCGANLCSGQTGSATVVATAPGGAPLVNQPIRFDVVFGPIGIGTSNPGTPLVQTLTVATDTTGTATAVIRALANATTQPAQVRATDVTSGQEQIANFTVQNSTTGTASPLTVVPATATITGATTATCSTGFAVDYYIYGGNPPYTVSSTFPAGVTLVNSTVGSSGGFFEAITNGSCVDPLTFTIVDSAGKQTTAALINKPGAGAPPAATPIVLTPPTVTDISCSGKTYSFILTGGTPPYNVSFATSPPLQPSSPPPGTILPAQIVAAIGGTLSVTFPAGSVPGFPSPVVVTSFVVVDSGTPQQTLNTGKITCN